MSNARNLANLLVKNSTPVVSVRNNSAQTISATTWTTVTLDTEVIDTQNSFASNVFTVPDVGQYYIVATIEVICTDTDELSRASIKLQKKPSGGSFADVAGTEQNIFKDHDSNESFTRVTVPTTFLYTSAASDEWRVQAYGNSGAGTIQLQSQNCTFIAFKIIG